MTAEHQRAARASGKAATPVNDVDWRGACQMMGRRMFQATKALESIALNYSEPARSGVMMALSCLDGIPPVAMDLPAALDHIEAQDKDLTEARERIGELEEEVELKQTALNIALVQNVEAMQLVLRNKVEATPVGYYDALTDARAKIAELEDQLLKLAAECERLGRAE